MPRRCSFKLELDYPQPLAGVDEAGCAPLAGPVVAGGVHPRPRQIPARDRRFEESAARKARGDLRTAGQMRGVGRRHRHGRGDRPDQHLLGADAGDDPRGRSAGLEPAWVLVDGNATPALAAAVEGDRRRRRQMPLDRRRLDHRQGHPRPDDGRVCATTIRAMAGSIIAAIRRPIIAARSTTLGLTPLHRRSFGLVREIEARKAQPGAGFRTKSSRRVLCATPTSD